MENRRLLICYAHPDDESFGLGAAIPKWIDDGVQVYLICATNGDVGHVPDALRGKYDTVAQLRLSELACARQYLKFEEVFMLGYRDSGMLGSETANHPECLAYCWRHEPERVAEDVLDVMRQVKPQVVITFNRYGGYGHPDHIAIQRATVCAFERLRGEAGAADNYAPQRLYYAAYPKLPLRMRIWKARLKGQDPRRMGINQDVDTLESLRQIEPVHATVSTASYLDIWEKASRCPASQGGGRISRTSRLLRRILLRKQGFTRAYPAPAQARVDEEDLFANVVLNDR